MVSEAYKTLKMRNEGRGAGLYTIKVDKRSQKVRL